MQIRRVLEERAALAGWRCTWLKDADSLVAGVNSWVAGEAARVAAETCLRTAERRYRRVDRKDGRTMVPLLSNAPLAQNEFVNTSSGWTVLVSRFQILDIHIVIKIVITSS